MIILFRGAHQQQKQRGFSLIELLVSMVIGLLVMSGVFQVFSSTKSATRLLEAEAELQENARFAFSVMTSIVQEAGNFGCQASTSVAMKSLVNTTDKTFRPGRVIEGWEANKTAYGNVYKPNVNSGVSKITTKHWTSSAGAAKDPGTKSKKKSDILKVWYSKNQSTPITGLAAGVFTFASLDLEKGDIIAINDCRSLTFAQVCACEDAQCDHNDTQANIKQGACFTPGNLSTSFNNLNISTTSLSIVEEAIFFVGKRGDTQKGYQKHIPALYVRNLGTNAKPGNKIEILEGVESMQVLYGEDTNNDNSPDYYISADSVVNWKKVVSLKISLLLRSRKNNLVGNKQALNFNGAPIVTQKGDHYLRRVFTSTISLRNRNIGF